MQRSNRKTVLISFFIAVFLAGLALLLYPHIRGAIIDRKLSAKAEGFLSREEAAPSVTGPSNLIAPTIPLAAETESTEPTGPEEIMLYPELLAQMQGYNEAIYAQGQSGLSCAYDYQKPSFLLANYGIEDEIFGVISIPVLGLEMPIYLGATYQHMADGAAHLSQTSIPIGGINSNAVIAGHRGWGGASYFRYITELEVGDEVIITNLWRTLTYKVVDTQIIWPHEVDRILIREGRDLITMLTCHPYASGGKQRYLVICERTE